MMMPSLRLISGCMLLALQGCSDQGNTSSAGEETDANTTAPTTTGAPTGDATTDAPTSDATTGAPTSDATSDASSDATTDTPTTDTPTSDASTGTTSTTEPGAVCGNGIPEDGEECDNGADNGDSTACTAACMVNICGDGKQGPGEGCDDGNLIDGDACSANCSLPGCGDGMVGGAEACDDANADNTDACTAACTAAVCGDGFLQPFNLETCDDGNLVNSDGCSDLCEGPPEATVLTLNFSPVKQFDFSWAAASGATFYRLLERPTPNAAYVQLGADILVTSTSRTMPLHLRFGASYILEACNDAACTGSAPVDVVDSMAAAVGYFKASNTGAGDNFGWSIALSADGNTLAVGAVNEDSKATGIGGDQADNSAGAAGAVYMY